MILRYSRITEYFVSVSTCSPRLSSNWRQFLFNYRLAFSFFFILVLPFTSHLFACYPFQSGSPPVYFLSIQLTSAFPSRCTHSIRSLLPPLFVIVFLSLIYLRSSVSFSLCYSYPFVSFIYIYTCLDIVEPTVFLSGKRGWYFRKEESLPKIVRTQLPLSN